MGLFLGLAQKPALSETCRFRAILERGIEREEREREMAGLLAWAADVVGGGGGQSNGENESISIPIIFTDEQRKYVQELDQKVASLSRAIQDLRLRLPPPDISQRLPHLHAHSIASNAALALQLNSHSATREQVCCFFNFPRFSKFELFPYLGHCNFVHFSFNSNPVIQS